MKADIISIGLRNVIDIVVLGIFSISGPKQPDGTDGIRKIIVKTSILDKLNINHPS